MSAGAGVAGPVGVTLQGVGWAYRAGEPVLADLTLSVRPGEVVALVGRSGCGKTTLLNVAAGLLAPQSGRVSFGTPPRPGYVFQDARLLPWLTLTGNMRFVRPDVTVARVREELGRVGLAGQEDAYPEELSLGMAQRAAVARALIVEPNLLLLDEPCAALDELTAAELRAALGQLLRERAPTTLLVTHHPAEAVLLADRVVVLGRRPSRVLGEVPVSAPRPRDPDDDALVAPLRAVRALLREDG